VKRFRLPALAAAVLLQACAAVPASVDKSVTPRCGQGGNPRDCYVEVEVKATASGCTVSVPARQQVIEFRRNDRDRFIYWTLDGPHGYEFRADGIFIPENKGEFDLFKVLANGREYRVRNRNTRSGQYKYTVHVVNERAAGAPVQCELDPRIHNE
jgi:hypothetical protein